MSWWSNLFMPQYQKALIDPAQYRAPVEKAQIISEIRRGASGVGDAEIKEWMMRMAGDINRNSDTFTIEQVGHEKDAAKASLERPHDKSFHNFAVMSHLGCDSLLKYMIERANNMARDVKPGAADNMAQAFTGQLAPA